MSFYSHKSCVDEVQKAMTKAKDYRGKGGGRGQMGRKGKFNGKWQKASFSRKL